MIALFIIGVAALIVGISTKNNMSPLSNFRNLLKIVGIILMILSIALASLVQIDPGVIGVKKLFGKVNDKSILQSGLNLVNPLVEVVRFNSKTQNYTMSGITDEGSSENDDAIRVLSADGLEVIIDLTVLYKIIPMEAPRILQELGTNYQDVVVRPICRTSIRDNAVYYDAVELYSSKRDEFQSRIFSGIEKDFKHRGLVLEQLLVRNITLPASVKASIESKINAEQEAQKMIFVLQKEQQEAERKRVEAQGIADYQRIISLGLTDKQLQYEFIKAISESTNSKLIIMGNGKGGAPIILDGK